jgi:hypothetical protein
LGCYAVHRNPVRRRLSKGKTSVHL